MLRGEEPNGKHFIRVLIAIEELKTFLKAIARLLEHLPARVGVTEHEIISST
jgi:hypothetical protein